MIRIQYIRALEDLYDALIAKAPYDQETKRYIGALGPELTAVKVLKDDLAIHTHPSHNCSVDH